MLTWMVFTETVTFSNVYVWKLRVTTSKLLESVNIIVVAS